MQEKRLNIPAAIYAMKKNLSLLKEGRSKSKEVSRGLIEPLLPRLKRERKEGVEEIISSELQTYMNEEGFYRIDFGSNVKIDAYLDGQNAHLFSFKATQKEFLPLILVSKNELADFFDLKKKTATYEILAEHLNALVDENFLRVQRGEPFLTTSRKKEITLSSSLEAILEGGADNMWEKEILSLSHEAMNHEKNTPEKNKQLLDLAESMILKMAERIDKKKDSPYISWRKGRESFVPETIRPFIEELEEKNMDIALKITRESSGKEKLTIKNCFSYEQIAKMENEVVNFLQNEYSRTIEFLSEKENRMQMEDGDEIAYSPSSVRL